MKVLLILYSQLLEDSEESLYRRLDINLSILQRLIGIDSIYASVSHHFKDIFDRFPELCLVNSLKDNPVFATYRGLRKLRGDDVLLVDGGVQLTKESLVSFFNRVHVTVGLIKERWSGMALIKMRDIDYMVRSLEKNFENKILDAFYTLRDTYSIATDFIDLKGKITLPILELD